MMMGTPNVDTFNDWGWYDDGTASTNQFGGGTVLVNKGWDKRRRLMEPDGGGQAVRVPVWPRARSHGGGQRQRRQPRPAHD